MIISKSNDLIKYCNQIKQKKYSKEFGFCFVESIKIVKELCKRGLINTVLSTENKLSQLQGIDAKIESGALEAKKQILVVEL